MKRFRLVSLVLLVIWLVQAACNMPTQQLPDTGGPVPSPTAVSGGVQTATKAARTATPVEPSATPSPRNTPPVSFTLGVISGIVWQDVCFRGGGDGPAPASPSTGCTLISEDIYGANGFREFNEPGITNLAISLGAGACPPPGSAPDVLATAVTDVDGTYSFAGLVAGKYCVFIDMTDTKNAAILSSGGWTFPNSDTAAQTITLTSGEGRTDVNFGWDGGLQVAVVGEPASSSGLAPAPAGSTAAPTASSGGSPDLSSTPLAPSGTSAASPGTGQASAGTPSGAPASVSSTPVPGLPYAGSGNLGQPEAACSNRASFVSDVTVPDDTVVPAGSAFVKTWRIRNDGTCTWTPGSYALVFTGGDALSGPDEVNLPGEVPPGETVDLSVNLVAPDTPGLYGNVWMLRVGVPSQGGPSYLGVGPDGNGPLYTRIVVNYAGVGQAGAGASLAATPLPPASLQVPVSGVSFEPGTTSAVVEGQLAPGEGAGYALRASQGYALIASLQSQSGDVVLDISAEDGTPLQVVSRPGGTYMVSELPANQRYIVKVIARSQESAYALTLEIPALISIDQNSGSASGGGTINAGRPVSYLLRAKAGQTLFVSLTSPGRAVGLSISGLHDGQALLSPDMSGGAASWTGTLPQTQAYLIQAVPLVESTSFTIQVSLK